MQVQNVGSVMRRKEEMLRMEETLYNLVSLLTDEQCQVLIDLIVQSENECNLLLPAVSQVVTITTD